MGKGLLPFYLFTLLLLSVPARAQYEVVPLPQSIQMQNGEPFLLSNDQVQILAPETLMGEAAFLQVYLKDVTGQTFSIVSKREKRKTYIELTISPNITESEGYVLTINKKGVTIAGGSAAGVFYGIQTLRKSLASIDKAAATSSIFHLPSSPMHRVSLGVVCTSTVRDTSGQWISSRSSSTCWRCTI